MTASGLYSLEEYLIETWKVFWTFMCLLGLIEMFTPWTTTSENNQDDSLDNMDNDIFHERMLYTI